MKNLYELLKYKKSWGRNQIINLDFEDKKLLHELSSRFENPNENLGSVLKYLANINPNYEILDLNFIDDFCHEFDENIYKETLETLVLSKNLNNRLVDSILGKIRFKNSKRHVRLKLYQSYFEMLHE